jgi:DNA-binding NtrC family response regulator
MCSMKTCSILLLNDDPQVIAALHEALNGVRHRLIVGPTTRAAMIALNEEPCSFDVLVVDLAGGLTGLALFDAVKNRCGRLPVIALTPADEWFVKEEAFLRGSLLLLDKPLLAAEVSTALPYACGCAGRRFPRKKRLPARGRVAPSRAPRR